MEDKAALLKCLGEKIYSGKATIERLKLAGKIDGIEKLIRKIQQEIKFLEKVCPVDSLDTCHAVPSRRKIITRCKVQLCRPGNISAPDLSILYRAQITWNII